MTTDRLIHATTHVLPVLFLMLAFGMQLRSRDFADDPPQAARYLLNAVFLCVFAIGLYLVSHEV